MKLVIILPVKVERARAPKTKTTHTRTENGCFRPSAFAATRAAARERAPATSCNRFQVSTHDCTQKPPGPEASAAAAAPAEGRDNIEQPGYIRKRRGEEEEEKKNNFSGERGAVAPILGKKGRSLDPVSKKRINKFRKELFPFF